MMKIKPGQAYSFCQQGQRSSQEDARYPDSDMPVGSAYIVCDGVGGHACGEVASRLVADTLGQAARAVGEESAIDALSFSRMLREAYDALGEHATHENRQMATTLTFVAFHAEGCFVAHVGDSRVYQLRPGSGIVFRTEDHSLVQELVRYGQLPPEKADTHPCSHIITRSLTTDTQARDAASMVNITDVEAGDYLLLCSDGVLHQADDATLERVILAAELTDEEKCQRLARLCEDSTDNNTAILIPVAEVCRDTEEAEGSAEDNEESTEASGSVETVPLPRANIYYNKVIDVAPEPPRTRMERLKRRLRKWFSA